MSQRETGRPAGLLLLLLQVIVVLGALLSRRPAPRQAASSAGVDPQAEATGYEHRDMQPRPMLIAALTLLVVMGLVLYGITAFEAAVTGIAPAVSRPQELIQGQGGAAAPTPAVPRLEAQSGQELTAYRAAATQQLDTYRWVDRQAGVVAIPIDRAMDLVVQQGLPTRPEPSLTTRDSGNRSPSRASSGRVEEAYP